MCTVSAEAMHSMTVQYALIHRYLQLGIIRKLCIAYLIYLFCRVIQISESKYAEESSTGEFESAYFFMFEIRLSMIRPI